MITVSITCATPLVHSTSAVDTRATPFRSTPRLSMVTVMEAPSTVGIWHQHIAVNLQYFAVKFLHVSCSCN